MPPVGTQALATAGDSPSPCFSCTTTAGGDPRPCFSCTTTDPPPSSHLRYYTFPVESHLNLGNNNDPDMPRLGADDSDDNRSSYDYQTYDVSDFYIFDMIVASLPVNENAFDGDIGDANFFPNYDYAEPSMLLDVAEQYIMLPFLEETVKMSDINNA
ncbi:hypothetical protein CMV_013189 [Castanea mollissima]|uniref:Uncharacterized protein n=1 Tax=Castanea mollissima TaxID=60419 RepID=A0A8J4VVW1_9ROSI|nr:hypothetical protein CMV_013189 [Castanea mollissima]